MKPNVLVALVVGLVLGFAGGKFASGPSADSRSPTAMAPAGGPTAPPRAGPRPVDPTVFRVPLEDSPVAGSSSALVTLVEFSDYECPFCSRANTTVKQLQKDYGDKLRVVVALNVRLEVADFAVEDPPLEDVMRKLFKREAT